MRINFFICCLIAGFTACTAHKKLIKTAQPVVNTVTTEKEKPVVVSNNVVNDIEQYAATYLLKDSNLLSAHVGISIYDPSTKKYLYNYQGDKYFIPASNTKLLTCYAAMKYLGDSLVGLRYSFLDTLQKSIYIIPTGDPSFLHPDFKSQPVFDFLKKHSTSDFTFMDYNLQDKELGYGWAWDDYNDDYMAERSEFPIYGNVARFYFDKDTIAVSPHFFYDYSLKFGNDYIKNKHESFHFKIEREFEENIFRSSAQLNSLPNFSVQYVPFKTTSNTPSHLRSVNIRLLEDTLKMKFSVFKWTDIPNKPKNIIHSQPTDSLLKITMHRSDNFFAEQTLLMVSNERLGLMSDEKIIDTLLKTDYKNFPQKPKWVDGSGLSRYNLISPQDFVFLLEKMKNEFAWNRITTILPTGDEGTLKGLYKNYVGKIYAKTGTVSNNLALSGYIITNKNKTFIFSVMVNNHQASASAIRKSIEKFISSIIENY